MTLFSTIFPMLIWALYTYGAPLIEKRRPSLSTIMAMQRHRWVSNAVKRDTPLDAILSGNLMGSVSFLASTTVLLVLAIFTAFGNLTPLMLTINTVGLSRYTLPDVEIHLFAMLVVFSLSFFAFTLSLRQFNHFCIMLGAIDPHGETSIEEVNAMAQLNTMAARNFNTGLRGYYFAVPMVAWFAAPWTAIVVSLMTLFFVIHREFFSSAHRVAASAALSAAKREQKL
jgi:uncharacterized membrane protein